MRRFARENLDWLRKALMLEPRGHADMYGGWLAAPAADSIGSGFLLRKDRQVTDGTHLVTNTLTLSLYAAYIHVDLAHRPRGKECGQWNGRN